MRHLVDDVRTFMLAGQPERVSWEVARPTPTPEEAAVLREAGAACVEAARGLRAPGATSAGLGGSLLLEELGETLVAMASEDLIETADGLADLVYVAVWTAVAHGIPLARVWDVVQASNLAKFQRCPTCFGTGCGACHRSGRVAVRDAAGKVLKPEGWAPPDVASALRGDP